MTGPNGTYPVAYRRGADAYRQNEGSQEERHGFQGSPAFLAPPAVGAEAAAAEAARTALLHAAGRRIAARTGSKLIPILGQITTMVEIIDLLPDPSAPNRPLEIPQINDDYAFEEGFEFEFEDDPESWVQTQFPHQYAGQPDYDSIGADDPFPWQAGSWVDLFTPQDFRPIFPGHTRPYGVGVSILKDPGSQNYYTGAASYPYYPFSDFGYEGVQPDIHGWLVLGFDLPPGFGAETRQGYTSRILLKTGTEPPTYIGPVFPNEVQLTFRTDTEVAPPRVRQTGPSPAQEREQSPDRVRVAPRTHRGIAISVGPVTDLATQPQTQPQPWPEVPAFAPPDTKVKERKIQVHKRLLGIVWAGLSAVTESVDLVTALWKALPKELRTGYETRRTRSGELYEKRVFYPTPQQMAQDLYRHWDQVNIQDAIWNVSVNHIEDAVIGKANQALTREARDYYDRSGRVVGFTTGPGL